MELMSPLLVLVIGLALGAFVGVLWARSPPAFVGRLGQGLVDQAEVMQGLDRLSDQLHDLEHARATWQGQLHQQVLDMRHTTDTLRRETQSLAQRIPDRLVELSSLPCRNLPLQCSREAPSL